MDTGAAQIELEPHHKVNVLSLIHICVFCFQRSVCHPWFVSSVLVLGSDQTGIGQLIFCFRGVCKSNFCFSQKHWKLLLQLGVFSIFNLDCCKFLRAMLELPLQNVTRGIILDLPQFVIWPYFVPKDAISIVENAFLSQYAELAITCCRQTVLMHSKPSNKALVLACGSTGKRRGGDIDGKHCRVYS